MKLMKFVPTSFAVVALAACSAQNSKTENTEAPAPQIVEQNVAVISNQASDAALVSVEKVATGSKSVAYTCLNNRSVTANYTFEGEEAKAVNLVLGRGKNAQKIPTLTRDDNEDYVSFASDQYMWNVETGFNYSNATTKTGGNLTKRGAESDEILAKLCNINKRDTAKLNK